MELGRQIKRYRTERGLSQEDFAAKIYVSRQTISNWETDKTYPDVESLLLISAFFDVTIDELIKGDVEAMQKAVNEDYKKMCVRGWVGTGLALIAAVVFIGGISFWNWNWIPSLIIWVLITGIALMSIAKSERIRKQHDLMTYREVLAFRDGKPIDRDNPRSQRARKHRVIKAVLTLIISGIAGGIMGYFAYGLFN